MEMEAGTSHGEDNAPPIVEQPQEHDYYQQMDDDEAHSDSIRLIDEYHHGLCGCFDNFGNCCLATICTPCAFCMVSSRLAENPCYPICFGILPLSVRFRTITHIEQSMCREGCEWVFCGCCALTRILNEMDTRSFKMQRK